MTDICPTILAANPHNYREQLERIEGWASRIQIDLTDGKFANSQTVEPSRIYWPKQLLVDIHVMYERPLQIIDQLLSMRPNLIILHAEANHQEINQAIIRLNRQGFVKKGIALLRETRPEDVEGWLKQADHCLIFAGELGSFGGEADLTQLTKVKTIREINPNLEIGWDGGVSPQNTAEIAAAGVDVINSGGFIQKSANSHDAYVILQQIASKSK